MASNGSPEKLTKDLRRYDRWIVRAVSTAVNPLVPDAHGSFALFYGEIIGAFSWGPGGDGVRLLVELALFRRLRTVYRVAL
jgi:hypothetical protein